MQKKLIALAIAGLAAVPAFAQTNVTIYGVADLTEEYVDGKGANNSRLDIEGRSRLSSNSSLLGFRGTEDLGNGLKAIFQFETGITADTGMGSSGNSVSLSARDTFVGLSSAWGTIVGGNLTSPVRNMGSKISMSPGATGIGFDAATYGTVLGVKTGTDDRAPNTVAYVTPAFMGGLTFTGAYVNGENKRNSDTITSSNTLVNGVGINAYQWQLGAQYEAGPAYFGLAYHDAKDPQILTTLLNQVNVTNPGTVTTAVGAYRDELKVWRGAGTYKFGTGTKIAGLIDWQKYEFDSNNPDLGNSDISRYAWDLGISQDFGPHTIYGEYSQANKAKVGGDADALGDTKIKQYTIGYNYWGI